MIDTIGKTILVEAIEALIQRLLGMDINGLTQEERERTSEAMVAMQRASIQTRNFIRDEGYEPNIELSELWQDALKKAINAKLEDLPDFLMNKAKFWGSPQDWLGEPSAMEMVPKLNYINEQCESLLERLR